MNATRPRLWDSLYRLRFLASQVVSKSGQQTCLFSLHSIFILLIEIFSYNGSAIVLRSMALGEPVVYVSMNYRCVKLEPLLRS